MLALISSGQGRSGRTSQQLITPLLAWCRQIARSAVGRRSPHLICFKYIRLVPASRAKAVASAVVWVSRYVLMSMPIVLADATKKSIAIAIIGSGACSLRELASVAYCRLASMPFSFLMRFSAAVATLSCSPWRLRTSANCSRSMRRTILIHSSAVSMPPINGSFVSSPGFPCALVLSCRNLKASATSVAMLGAITPVS